MVPRNAVDSLKYWNLNIAMLKAFPTQPYILVADQLIDGDGSCFPAGTALRIQDGKIADIGVIDDVKSESVSVLTAPGSSAMPGFIDCHGYLSVDPNRPDPMGGMHGEDLVERAWLTAKHLSEDLDSGVTTMRVMGEGQNIDLRAKDAIAEGILRGPRLLCSGAPICPSFSHQAPPNGGADGVEGVRRAVRMAIAGGVDWIKLLATGGVNAPGDRATTTLYSSDEIDAVFEECRRTETPVAVAAHGGTSIRQCAEQGARTFEHCAFFDDDALDISAEARVTLVLTLARFFLPNGIERSGKDVPGVPERLQRARENLTALVPKAIDRGASIVLGTDNMHGGLPLDAIEFVRLGASPEQAISALTGEAAATLGVSNEVGHLKVGMRADFAILNGNPLADIRHIAATVAVIRDGLVAMGIDNLHRTAS